MTLLLVGLGPSPELRDLTRRGEEALRRAQRVLVDIFTAAGGDRRCAAIAQLVEHPIERLVGPDATVRAELIEAARAADVAIAVAGDPLLATPHGYLCQQARQAGVPVEIIPGVSVATAGPSLLGRDPAAVPVVVIDDPWRPRTAELALVAAALDGGVGCLVIGAGRIDGSGDPWPALASTLAQGRQAQVQLVSIDGADTAALVRRTAGGSTAPG
jgi:uroporphyrin-III C-methyltransferase